MVRIDATGSHESSDPWEGIARLREIQETIASRLRVLATSWRETPKTRQLGDALSNARPQVTVGVPLRTDDAAAIRTASAAEQVVRESIEGSYRHWVDVSARLAGLQVQMAGGYLFLTSRSADFAVDAAEAYLRANRPAPRPRLRGAKPVWAWGSAAIAAVSLGLSFAPLTTATVILLGCLTGLAAIVSSALAPRWLARRSHTLLGMAPAIALIAFACIYGTVALLEPTALQLGAHSSHDLRDPLLLSLGLLTTSGLLDFGVHGWLRSVAYLEMLLIAGFAGGAAIVAARRASALIRESLAALRRDREE